VAEHWEAPFPFGYAAAAENTGSVAAPLLAGFSFALVGLIIPAPGDLRWPNLALCLLVASGVSFIAAVQCGFWARQFVVTPDELRQWHPEYAQGRMHALQRLHARCFQRWNGRLNRSYRAGIVLLLLGVTFALVPPGHVGWLRSLAVAIAAAATAAELLWIGSTWLLAGSPTMAYDDQPDAPKGGVPARALRTSRPLRAVARQFVPLERIQLTAEEKAPDPS
jgi:hypothetical protein